MKITLKPCPFCGGEAALTTKQTRVGEPTRAFVSCKDCNASAATFYDYDHDGLFVFSAIDAWNKRIEDISEKPRFRIGGWEVEC